MQQAQLYFKFIYLNSSHYDFEGLEGGFQKGLIYFQKVVQKKFFQLFLIIGNQKPTFYYFGNF